MIVPRPREAVTPRDVERERLLLVEGETPAHFFEAFLGHLSRANEVEVRSYGGITQLATYLKTIAATAAFRERVTSLGIARDAEDDPVAARQSMEAAIKSAALPRKVAVQLAVIPDGSRPGMIETLLVQSVSGRKEFRCVERFFECVTAAGSLLPEGPIIAKHQVQVFLATRRKAQMMPGIAAYDGVWPFDDPLFNDVRDFLEKL